MNIQAYKITILSERRISEAEMKSAVKGGFPNILTSAIIEPASPEFDMVCDDGSIRSYPKR